MRIDNKQTFYRLALEGKCGNTPHMWKSVEEYWPFRHQYPMVAIRRLISSHPKLTPGISYQKVPPYLLANKVEEGTYIISEIPKDDRKTTRVIQGELSWRHGAWYLYYTNRGGFMREALKRDGHHEYGWNVILLLKRFVTPSDFNDLMSLFKRYTHAGHEYPVIEFSVMRGYSAGRLLGRNVLIWEIRHY